MQASRHENQHVTDFLLAQQASLPPGSKKAATYDKALDSVRRCPLRLRPRELSWLAHFSQGLIADVRASCFRGAGRVATGGRKRRAGEATPAARHLPDSPSTSRKRARVGLGGTPASARRAMSGPAGRSGGQRCPLASALALPPSHRRQAAHQAAAAAQ